MRNWSNSCLLRVAHPQFKLDDTAGCYYSRVDQRSKYRGDHRVAEAC
jgi:hypothetical protein